MSILKTIEEESVRALRNRQPFRREALTFLLSMLKNESIKKKGVLEDADIFNILAKAKKASNETLEAAKKGDREELIQKAEFELEIIDEFLPKEPNLDDVKNLVMQIIKDNSFSSVKDMGNIIKLVVATLPTVDKAKLSNIIKESL